MDLKIFILTHKRYHRQITWESLTEFIRRYTQLVVVHGEAQHYPKYPVIETPPEILGIGATRQWVLDNAGAEKIVMLDDDLTFAIRKVDDRAKFEAADVDNTNRIFSSLDMWLDRYAHVSILAREFGNTVNKELLECSRAMRVLGFNVPILQKLGVKFNPELTQDDFDITLKLLKRGYPNLVLAWAVQNQSGSGTAGGASEYRDIAAHNASVLKLAALHPEFVTVVEKHTKVAWGGQPRLDVKCLWKKAYKSSVIGSKNVSLLDALKNEENQNLGQQTQF